MGCVIRIAQAAAVAHIVQPRGATPSPRSGAEARRSPCPERWWPRGHGREELPHAPTPEVRGVGWEDQPHVQGVVAARAEEGLEELFHVEGQEGRR